VRALGVPVAEGVTEGVRVAEAVAVAVAVAEGGAVTSGSGEALGWEVPVPVEEGEGVSEAEARGERCGRVEALLGSDALGKAADDAVVERRPDAEPWDAEGSALPETEGKAVSLERSEPEAATEGVADGVVECDEEREDCRRRLGDIVPERDAEAALLPLAWLLALPSLCVGVGLRRSEAVPTEAVLDDVALAIREKLAEDEKEALPVSDAVRRWVGDTSGELLLEGVPWSDCVCALEAGGVVVEEGEAEK
jgi:hypothetical protein